MTKRTNRAKRAGAAVSCLAPLLFSCSGELHGGSEGPGAEGTAEFSGEWRPGEGGGDPNAVASLPLRMITSEQYENSVRLVFEDYGVSLSGLDASSVLQAESVDDSGFLVVGEVSDVSVLRYLDAARAVAVEAMPHAEAWVGCDLQATSDEAACVQSFVESFGELLYRRPLDEPTVDGHVAFYQEERNDLMQTPVAALSQLLQSMLNSPYFLYRWEQGPEPPEVEGDALRLSPYQVASRLSFYLWGSGPDRELLDAAKTGELDTIEGVEKRARAMLADPRAEDALESFHAQWLDLEALEGLFKDPARFPDWDEELSHAMQEEVEHFTSHVILEGDGLLSTLLSAPYSFVNEKLAGVYGIDGVSGDELRRVDLPAGRSGLLTMPGLLAAASEPSVENPFKRGKVLLEQVLCQKLEPPPNVPPFPAPDEDNPQPVRDTLEELTEVKPCIGCHAQLNPLGFAFAHFNAIGAYQEEDELGFPIDSSGALSDGTRFSGPGELSAALSNSVDVQGCLTKQWFRFATVRADEAADHHSLEEAYQRFKGSEFNIRELLVAIVTTRSFLYRARDEGEVYQ